MNDRALRGRTLLRLSLVALVALAAAACGPKKPTPEELERQSLMASGERLEGSGDYDAALVQYVKLLGADAENVEAHYRIGRVHSALGNAGTARDAFQRVLAKSPRHVGALEGMGLLQLEAGQRDVAASLLHKSLAKDATRWRAYNGLGVLADLKGKHPLAQAYFSSALKLRPSDPALVNNLGYSMYLGGNVRDAQKQFESAIAVDPSYQKSWSNLGLVLTRQGQYARAVQSLERIMSPSEARYSVGYICLLDGKLDEAERLLRESARMSTTYAPATHAAIKRVRAERARRALVGDEDETQGLPE